MKRIRIGDEVIVLTGRAKGQRGTVRELRANGRCIVSGVNMVKKHRRAVPSRQITAGIVEIEASLPLSNVAHYDAASDKPSRVGIRVAEDGTRVRYYKRSGEPVPEPEKSQ
ncbi:MAG: 50S ribosomal protein L24 [Gammaproteobacteria bacterium AqS3]|nr:50S ribosomal protein L24 [Gammaproteobacteria bacterium AqS3]